VNSIERRRVPGFEMAQRDGSPVGNREESEKSVMRTGLAFQHRKMVGKRQGGWIWVSL